MSSARSAIGRSLATRDGMNTHPIEEFIRAKQEQLIEFEHRLEETAKHGVNERLVSFRKQRDDLAARLDGLKRTSGDRIDVLRMGIESAWDELVVAFETAFERDTQVDEPKGTRNEPHDTLS
jgi:N12 class adenine-specific DNA methylase